MSLVFWDGNFDASTAMVCRPFFLNRHLSLPEICALSDKVFISSVYLLLFLAFLFISLILIPVLRCQFHLLFFSKILDLQN